MQQNLWKFTDANKTHIQLFLYLHVSLGGVVSHEINQYYTHENAKESGVPEPKTKKSSMFVLEFRSKGVTVVIKYIYIFKHEFIFLKHFLLFVLNSIKRLMCVKIHNNSNNILIWYLISWLRPSKPWAITTLTMQLGTCRMGFHWTFCFFVHHIGLQPKHVQVLSIKSHNTKLLNSKWHPLQPLHFHLW